MNDSKREWVRNRELLDVSSLTPCIRNSIDLHPLHPIKKGYGGNNSGIPVDGDACSKAQGVTFGRKIACVTRANYEIRD
jgi:hypothetical protein